MSIHVHMLPPSVNSLAVRVFLRASGLPFTEENAWGKTRSPEFLAKVPSHLTPALESAALPRGAMWESSAILMYLANAHGLEAFYPSDPGRRALVDSANFYVVASLYPLIARATYPLMGFPSYPGEIAASDAPTELKLAAVEGSAAALAEPLEVIRSFFIRDGFIGDGEGPSIADIKLAASLEFLALQPSYKPAWVDGYVARVEGKLGAAYSEPAGDVRGFLAQFKKSA